jgi:TM2 domain-containing membrane protein YozV
MTPEAEQLPKKLELKMRLRQAPSPYFAFILSFLWSGLGNVYAGQFWTGLLLAFAYGMSLLGTVLFYGFVTTPFLWLFGLTWAVRGARRARRKSEHTEVKKDTFLRKLWSHPATRLGLTLALLLLAGLVIYDVPIIRSTEPLLREAVNPPDRLELDLSNAGLTEDAAGLTYFLLDLALQPVDDWIGFNSLDQFGQSALRYQLAFMTYALAQVHYLRLPAYPAPFRTAIDNLIQRMMQRRVWSYWYFENLWGNWTENPDPVYEKNVMYSGHLANMIGLYELLFNDHKYDAPGSIRFVWDQDTVFEYDHESLVERLYIQMRDNPYHSIACEPQQVFVMCNDHAALSLMLFDATHGTQWSEVNSDFIANLDRLFHGNDGSFHYPYYYALDATLPLHLAVGDAWALTFMHPFARERVRQMYPAFIQRHGLWRDDSTAKVTGQVVEFMDIGNYRFSDASQVSFGLVLASEVGDSTFAEGIWQYALQKYRPTKENGKLYFQHASLLVNSILLLGRVNHTDGLWRLYNQGWPEAHFQQPQVQEVNLEHVVVLRADFSEKAGLTVELKPRHLPKAFTRVNVSGLQANLTYTLLRNGNPVQTFQTKNGDYEFTTEISDLTQFVFKPNFH